MARRVIVVEDRSSFGPALVTRLRELGLECRWVTPERSKELAQSVWKAADLVLLDALDIGLQQSDGSRSRLESLDLLEQLDGIDGCADVVVYSTAMQRPEVNIPVRGLGSASAFYDVSRLTAHLREIVAGNYRDQVAAPSLEDWQALDRRLTPMADVAGAHQAMRRHDRSWRQVWDDHARFDKAAQVWISRNVLPLLGNPERGGYSLAVDVVRKVSGLPFRLI